MATSKKKKPAKTTKRAPARKVKPIARTKPNFTRTSRISPRTRPAYQPAKPAPTAQGLPEILFEGDLPESAPASPGQRFATGLTPPQEPLISGGELPEAYGTQQVLVIPRDPHWLYVHWDLTREQLREYNTQSVHKHLVLRLSRPDQENASAGEVHVHPESRHWFVHVAVAGVKYGVELGYYGKSQGWTRISKSAPATMPPDVVSGSTDVRFATIPADVALSKLVDIVKSSADKDLALAHAIEAMRLAGNPALPPMAAGDVPKPWGAEQERALAEIINVRQLGRVTAGSMDITELVKRELQQDFSSMMAALSGPGGTSSLSSPTGGAPTGPRGFWFNVNAELIIYGATERDAKVSIGGQKVSLRPDGSFSHRFALPDGRHELPVTAVSADDAEARHANLQFSRSTQVVGEVGQHPQDPTLKGAKPEDVS